MPGTLGAVMDLTTRDSDGKQEPGHAHAGRRAANYWEAAHCRTNPLRAQGTVRPPPGLRGGDVGPRTPHPPVASAVLSLRHATQSVGAVRGGRVA